MFYLILAIVIACMLNIVFKVAAIKNMNSDNITFINYFVAMCMAVFSAASQGQFAVFSHLGEASFATLTTEKSLGNTALTICIFGLIQGVIFLVNLIVHKESIAKNGAGISSFFKQSGFIGGVLLAVVFFNEKVGGLQFIGIALTVAALIILIGDFKSLDIVNPGLLIFMLFAGTLIEIDNKAFAAFGIAEYKPLFLATVFIIAFILCIFYIYKRVKDSGQKLRFTPAEIVAGVLLGSSNMLNNLFKLKALDVLDASIVSPSIAGGTLLIMTLAGVFVFKEKTSRQHILSVIIGIVGLVLINI